LKVNYRSDSIRAMELLAPTGASLRQVRRVLDAGADAIYFGVRPPQKNQGRLSLLTSVVEFDFKTGLRAVQEIHRRGKRAYVALNAYYSDAKLAQTLEVAKDLINAGIDAFIVADCGLAAALAPIKGDAELHLSILGRSTNHESAAFWRDLGVSRVIVDRVLPLRDIMAIKEQGRVEVEVFVYGSNCFNHHGLCRLSSYMNGFMCLAPCMESYRIEGMENAGLTPFRSVPLNAYEDLPLLHEAGIDALKIEGRQKSPAAIATLVSIFKKGIDALDRGEPLPDVSDQKHFHKAPLTWSGMYRGIHIADNSINHEKGLKYMSRLLEDYVSYGSLKFLIDRELRLRRTGANRPPNR
jgi:U32 family peptidase